MANMGYCRFQNTLSDLRDCHEHLEDDLSREEAGARRRLAILCRQIADDAEDAGLLDPEASTNG